MKKIEKPWSMLTTLAIVAALAVLVAPSTFAAEIDTGQAYTADLELVVTDAATTTVHQGSEIIATAFIDSGQSVMATETYADTGTSFEWKTHEALGAKDSGLIQYSTWTTGDSGGVNSLGSTHHGALTITTAIGVGWDTSTS